MRPITAAILFSLSSTLFASCDDLFFSEYIEGSSNNKAIEIYNPSASDIDLSTYTLERYSNGATTASSTMTLSGTLASGAVYVIANSSAVVGILDVSDTTHSVIGYNGDDAMVLKHNGSVIDAIGQVGTDPGSSWSANGVSTANQTLVRKSSISGGDTVADDAFDPSAEWDAYDQDTFNYLGEHTVDGCTQGASSLSDSSSSQESSSSDASSSSTSSSSSSISSEASSSSASSEATITLIHEIQGTTDVSPMTNANVTVEAVVVGVFPAMSGFFIQEEDSDIDADANTSEGIFVYCTTSTCKALNTGDLVRLSGTVKEYYNFTELSSISDATLISSDNLLPTPTSVTLPIDNVSDFEAYEGMSVVLSAQNGQLSVAENYQLGRYGEFIVSSGGRPMQFTHNNAPDVTGYSEFLATLEKRTLMIDDGNTSQNPDPVIFPAGNLDAANTLRSGYSIDTIAGCMTYSYGEYIVEPTESLVFDDTTNPRIESAPEVNGTLTVASFNVLNYFNEFSGCLGGVDGDSMSCRGADDSTEFTRQRTKIINAMLTIDADIYGLMEIQNNGYDANSALADLVSGLNDVAGADTFAFVDVDTRTTTTNALGTDAIKVAMIYKPAKVTLGKTVAAYLDQVDKNRPSLIQTFIDTTTQAHLSVSVNHLKSKGSDCESLGDPDALDGQGNCNLTRTAAATELMRVIASEFADEQNVLVIGDLNAYAMEDPVTTIKNAGFQDLNSVFHGEAAYSYVFDGQIGYLDHALASNNLVAKISGVDHWHINCDEPSVLDYNTNYKTTAQQSEYYSDSVFRSSDHDPVIIGINLTKQSSNELNITPIMYLLGI